MRTPSHIPRDVLTEAVEKYMDEVRRIRREELRASIVRGCEVEGLPVFEEDELEAYIDVMEALLDAGQYDPDTIMHLIDEMECSPEGKLSSEQILMSLENRLVRAAPKVTDKAILDQYHFEVTGKISTRCDKCRRGYHWTQQDFMQNRLLQRMLIGDRVTCSFCHTGHIKVYGVTAVLRDSTTLSQENL